MRYCIKKLYLVEHASPRETLLLRGGGPPPAGDECDKMAACFQPTLQTFKHRYVCVICPKLMHISLNCTNIDALFRGLIQHRSSVLITDGLGLLSMIDVLLWWRFTISNADWLMRSLILQTFRHRYVCVLCPRLVHIIYLNCNIDALFTTERQF